MERIEYRNVIDKSEWPRGPWDDEPDKVQWPDPTTGLPCLMVRNPHSGSWCGYVGVPEGHPDYNRHYDSVDVSCHGGLTFAGDCMESDNPAKRVCHVPGMGESDDVWWLGFDCAHAWDLSPGMGRFGFQNRDDTYRDAAYVTAQVQELAAQLAGRKP